MKKSSSKGKKKMEKFLILNFVHILYTVLSSRALDFVLRGDNFEFLSTLKHNLVTGEHSGMALILH